MSNDLQQARVTAAAKAMWGRDLEKSKEFYPERPSMWAKERPAYAEYAALALAAADAVVTVEMIADLLARELDGNDGDDLGSAHGEGALHLALDFPIREAIEDVYADCGDSDPRVLSTNIAKRLAYLLPPAVLALLRGGEDQ